MCIEGQVGVTALSIGALLGLAHAGFIKVQLKGLDQSLVFQ